MLSFLFHSTIVLIEICSSLYLWWKERMRFHFSPPAKFPSSFLTRRTDSRPETMTTSVGEPWCCGARLCAKKGNQFGAKSTTAFTFFLHPFFFFCFRCFDGPFMIFLGRKRSNSSLSRIMQSPFRLRQFQQVVPSRLKEIQEREHMVLFLKTIKAFATISLSPNHALTHEVPNLSEHLEKSVTRFRSAWNT